MLFMAAKNGSSNVSGITEGVESLGQLAGWKAGFRPERGAIISSQLFSASRTHHSALHSKLFPCEQIVIYNSYYH